MKFLLESTSWVFSSLLVMAVAIGISIALLIFIHKRVSLKTLKSGHDVAGFTFSIIGVLYSVILGFTVISVQDRYNEALESLQSEALLLADLYQDAAYFAPEEREDIRLSLRRYVDHVLKEEWWLAVDNKIDLRSRAFIKNIWNSYYNVDITDEKVKIWYTESISKLNNFLNARLKRQFNSREHLGALMWTLLIIGAVITICFMFFFGLENFRSHMLMTALLAGYLAFMLYLVYTLDHVFKGPQGIKPVALEQVNDLFIQWDHDAVRKPPK